MFIKAATKDMANTNLQNWISSEERQQENLKHDKAHKLGTSEKIKGKVLRKAVRKKAL